MNEYGRAEQSDDRDFIPKEGMRELKLANPEVKLSDRLSNLEESIMRLRESIGLLFDKVRPVMRPEPDEDETLAMKEPSAPFPMSEVASLLDDYRSQIQSLERMIHRNLNRIEL
jgi:hypothetical protein